MAEDRSVPGEEPVWTVDTPIGPVEYRTARGLRIGETGLNIGGFATIEAERPDPGGGLVEVEGVNFLLLFEPIPAVLAFAELEVGDLFSVEIDGGDTASDPDMEVDRLYGDLRIGDPLNLRIGKFLSPIGRWNPIPAEPFVWTVTEPVFVERAFDEHQTGGMLFGSFFPASGTMEYSIYGQFLDPLDADPEPRPARQSAGARFEYTTTLGGGSVGASFLASERDDGWHYTGGLDARVQTGGLDLTFESVLSRGDFEERDLWGAYLQGVYEVVPTFYLVGRYEHFDPSGPDPTLNLADVGVAWLPLPYLQIKSDYRIVDRRSDEVPRGFGASLGVIF